MRLYLAVYLQSSLANNRWIFLFAFYKCRCNLYHSLKWRSVPLLRQIFLFVYHNKECLLLWIKDLSSLWAHPTFALTFNIPIVITYWLKIIQTILKLCLLWSHIFEYANISNRLRLTWEILFLFPAVYATQCFANPHFILGVDSKF